MQLYTVSNIYVKQLFQVDSEVFYEPINYDSKPYVGILVQNNTYDYFIPLTSAKNKHKQWNNVTKTNYIIYEMFEPNLSDIPTDWVYTQTKYNIKHILSVLEIKKMIPVPKGYYFRINFSDITDDNYRALLQKEYFFLKPLQDAIFSKANKIYAEQKSTGIIRLFYCNFSKLEEICDKIESDNMFLVNQYYYISRLLQPPAAAVFFCPKVEK